MMTVTITYHNIHDDSIHDLPFCKLVFFYLPQRHAGSPDPLSSPDLKVPCLQDPVADVRGEAAKSLCELSAQANEIECLNPGKIATC